MESATKTPIEVEDSRGIGHEGETGVLFRAGDVTQLAGAISFLVERPKLAAEMGAAGRTLVINQDSAESHYAALANLYEQLAPRPKQADGRDIKTAAKQGLRIAFIGGRGVVSKNSGIETYYEEIGKRLAEMGHDVTVYCRTYFNPAEPAYNGMRPGHVPNGTTLRQRRTAGRLHEWDLEPGGYILFLGHFSPEKNCELLMQAYEHGHTSKTRACRRVESL